MDLGNYVPVNQRLIEALKRWPDLRVQETGFETKRLEDDLFLVCEVTVWRTPDDTHPAIASAAEPFPGKSAFTRDSERMVGFTSALGRALGYMGIGIQEAMASSNEVQARVEPRDSRSHHTPQASSQTETTEAQKRMLKALGYASEPPKMKKETSALIDKLKADAMGEEPF